VAICTIIMNALNDTKTDGLERSMLVYDVGKLNRSRMSDGFLADTVETTFSSLYVQRGP